MSKEGLLSCPDQNSPRGRAPSEKLRGKFAQQITRRQNIEPVDFKRIFGKRLASSDYDEAPEKYARWPWDMPAKEIHTDDVTLYDVTDNIHSG